MYIEVFILDNLLMNYLIFTTAQAIFGRPARRGFLLLGSLCGTAYAFVSAAYLPLLLHPVCKALFGCVLALFLCRQLRHDILGATASLFASTLLLGGIAYAIALSGSGNAHFLVIESNAILRALLLTAVTGILLPRGIRLIFRQRVLNRQSMMLKITHSGKSMVLRAMVDTGNDLYDPVSGLPVIVVNERFMLDAPARPVPCQTVTGISTLVACRPERIQAHLGRWLDISALIAASPQDLGSIDALVGAQVFR